MRHTEISGWTALTRAECPWWVGCWFGMGAQARFLPCGRRAHHLTASGAPGGNHIAAVHPGDETDYGGGLNTIRPLSRSWYLCSPLALHNITAPCCTRVLQTGHQPHRLPVVASCPVMPCCQLHAVQGCGRGPGCMVVVLCCLVVMVLVVVGV